MNTLVDYRLYLVTDSDLCALRDLPHAVEEAVKGGVTLVQIREKYASTLDFYRIALQVKTITDQYHVPLIINDRLDIALAIDADGLHIGQSDLPASIARKLLGKNKLLGVSVGNLVEAKQAAADGADYLGVGTVFPTSTKDDTKPITFEEIRKINEEIPLPTVGIGGIKENNIGKLQGLGFDGVAVVSAIIGQEDPKQCAKNLLNAFSKIQ